MEQDTITFVVEGANWTKEIKIENDFSNKYKDRAFEAMTRAVDQITYADDEAEKEFGFGPVMTAFEKDYDDDLDKRVVTLTEHVLRNCGHHGVAAAFNEKLKGELKDKLEQMEGYENPMDDEA